MHLDTARITSDPIPAIFPHGKAQADLDISVTGEYQNYGHAATRLLCTCGARDRTGEDVAVVFTVRNEWGNPVAGPLDLSLRVMTQAEAGPGWLDVNIIATVRSIIA